MPILPRFFPTVTTITFFIAFFIALECGARTPRALKSHDSKLFLASATLKPIPHLKTEQSSSLLRLAPAFINTTSTNRLQMINTSNLYSRDKKKTNPELTIRSVPQNINRFDYPWRLPPRIRLLSLEESHYRVLYSPLRSISGDGLGHAMATVNADLSTAIRLNLTYTHRVAGFASLTRQPVFNDSSDETRYQHGGAVEELFGWGVGEIPRERVQHSICPDEKIPTSGYECCICVHHDLIRRKKQLRSIRSHSPHRYPFASSPLNFNQVVEIPTHLSYFYPHPPTQHSVYNAKKFLRKYYKPYTVFSMPHSYCNQSPAYSIFEAPQRSYFFHKYWDIHGHNPTTLFKSHEKSQFKSVEDYRMNSLKDGVIRPLTPRAPLANLKQTCIQIAIHARRGDFFQVRRPMVPTITFIRLVRFVVARVIRFHRDDVFSRMPICVVIYSEGQSRENGMIVRGHDVSTMNDEYIDTDRSVQSEADVMRLLRNSTIDKLGDVFGENDLMVSLRVSRNTILTVHEMIAADIFIGSQSGMSTQVVGSISRAGFILLPCCDRIPANGHVPFSHHMGDKDGSNLITDDSLTTMRLLWYDFSRANSASAMRALGGL